jgi:hypothetical protein
VKQPTVRTHLLNGAQQLSINPQILFLTHPISVIHTPSCDRLVAITALACWCPGPRTSTPTPNPIARTKPAISRRASSNATPDSHLGCLWKVIASWSSDLILLRSPELRIASSAVSLCHSVSALCPIRHFRPHIVYPYLLHDLRRTIPTARLSSPLRSPPATRRSITTP